MSLADRFAVLAFARLQLADAVRDEPRWYDRIQSYYEAAGWRGPRDRAGETYEGGFAWCGAFAAACHASTVGDLQSVEPLAPAERVHLLSTYRLHENCRERRVELHDVRAGDVLVVGRDKHYGDHITIVLDVVQPGGPWITIEGNARGGQVGQTRIEGVVSRVRGVTEATVAYRFTA